MEKQASQPASQTDRGARWRRASFSFTSPLGRAGPGDLTADADRAGPRGQDRNVAELNSCTVTIESIVAVSECMATKTKLGLSERFACCRPSSARPAFCVCDRGEKAGRGRGEFGPHVGYGGRTECLTASALFLFFLSRSRLLGAGGKNHLSQIFLGQPAFRVGSTLE